MQQLDINNILTTIRSLDVSLPFYEKCKRILIYGAGNMGKDIYSVLNSRGIRVEGFLDQKAAIQEKWNGIPVYQPSWDGLSTTQKGQTAIIIALHNQDVFVPPIIEYLKKLGYGAIVTPVEFFDYFSKEMGDRYWLTSRTSYKGWEKDILEGYSTWADEASRQNYLRILEFRLSGDYSAQPLRDSGRKDFPSDFLTWRTPLRVVDGGAFDGDTLRSLLESQYAVESVALFEPDQENFQNLLTYVSSSWKSQIYLWPCGIYSRTEKLIFSSRGGEYSTFSKSGDTMIQAVALDDVIPSFEPNLIKFDIEGAEYDGLMGAKKIIDRNHPGLSICVYHRPQDLWQIPLLIKNWGLGYKLYLRTYRHNGFDSVMYATMS
jgi:FkbM family methyltransferase